MCKVIQNISESGSGASIWEPCGSAILTGVLEPCCSLPSPAGRKQVSVVLLTKVDEGLLRSKRKENAFSFSLAPTMCSHTRAMNKGAAQWHWGQSSVSQMPTAPCHRYVALPEALGLGAAGEPRCDCIRQRERRKVTVNSQVVGCIKNKSMLMQSSV